MCWRVPSRDRSGTYTVEWLEWSGEIRCHCQAAQYGRPCCHAGSVVHALQQRAEAMRPRTRAEQARAYLAQIAVEHIAVEHIAVEHPAW
jgi:hypothetical protein